MITASQYNKSCMCTKNKESEDTSVYVAIFPVGSLNHHEVPNH